MTSSLIRTIVILLSLQATECKFTIDHYGIDLIDGAARDGVIVNGTTYTPADAPTDWDATIESGQEWVWKKNELPDRFEEGSVNIFEKTLRGVATFIVGGVNIARVIRQLPDFKPSSVGGGKSIPTGPMVIGELGGRTVVVDPMLPSVTIDGDTVLGRNRYIMGFRGPDFLYAGMVYAPYVKMRPCQVIGNGKFRKLRENLEYPEIRGYNKVAA